MVIDEKVTNESVRKLFFNCTNTWYQLAKQKPTFIGKAWTGGPGLGGVLTGRRFFVTSVEVVLTVGLVWCHSMSKDSISVVLLSVPNSRHRVLFVSW